ncbi:MAG: endoglucanase, partial [Caulobacteraceae bacterium]
LDQARLMEASGHPDQALPVYDMVAQATYPGVATTALLRATEIRQAQNKLAPNQIADLLSSIRYRWRGDGTELEATRALGRLYIAQGRYREALEALRSSSQTLPDLPASAAIQGDLGAAFRGLYLDGGADGLPPLQSLALFLDFKDLTPIGADGDLMVRKLARRLVDVDLLDQAAQLLKYQADNRLDGVPRAQVDTDLAVIQLMNHQPEAALDALNSSRSTLLPADLQQRRRVIQARALSAMGRYDDALEIVGKDASPDAMAVRADAAWRKHDWPTAGRLLETTLGKRYQSPQVLSDDEQADLLRAAIAYSLAGDDGSLTRLRTRYAKLADGSSQPNALKVALAGVHDGVPAAAYTQTGPDTDGFTDWVKAMKARLLNSPTLAKG